MLGDGGAQYIESWLSRLRMRRQSDAASLEEAERMRREDNNSELKGRFIALAVIIGLSVVFSLFS